MFEDLDGLYRELGNAAAVFTLAGGASAARGAAENGCDAVGPPDGDTRGAS